MINKTYYERDKTKIPDFGFSDILSDINKCIKILDSRQTKKPMLAGKGNKNE